MGEVLHIGNADLEIKEYIRTLDLKPDEIARRSRCIPKSVYVLVTDKGYVKIGVASNVSKRIRVIERDTPQYGEVTDYSCTDKCKNAYIIEEILHRFYANFCAGREWFEIDYGGAVTAMKDAFLELSVINSENDGPKVRYKCDSLLAYFNREEVPVYEHD